MTKPTPPTTEDFRGMLFEFLQAWAKPQSGHSHQFEEAIYGVQHIYARRLGREATWSTDKSYWRDEYTRQLQHVAWDLILSRVLIPGSKSGSNVGWPFLDLTEHGRKVVAEQKPVPYDPDRFLAHARSIAPGLHPTAVRYLAEAVDTFRTGNYLAAAVMLGASSERICDDLADSILQAIGDAAKKAKFQKEGVDAFNLSKRRSTVIDWCKAHRRQLAGEWKTEERIGVIDKLSDFIRIRRNDAGHPQDPPAEPTHEEVYSWLVVYPTYCKWIYELKTDLDSRPGQIA